MAARKRRATPDPGGGESPPAAADGLAVKKDRCRRASAVGTDAGGDAADGPVGVAEKADGVGASGDLGDGGQVVGPEREEVGSGDLPDRPPVDGAVTQAERGLAVDAGLGPVVPSIDPEAVDHGDHLARTDPDFPLPDGGPDGGPEIAGRAQPEHRRHAER